MTRSAWLFFWAVILGATVQSVLAFATAEYSVAQGLTFLVLTGLAIIAQLYKAEAPNHVHFYATPVFVFAGLLLLDPALFILLVIVYHLVEWFKERFTDSPHLRAWYIQPFNIASEINTGLTAHWLYGALLALLSGLGNLAPVLAGALTATSFVAISYAQLGVMLILGRGKSWREIGLLDPETFVSDLILLLLGYVVSILWEINPWYLLVATSPLVLLYRALMIPQLKEEAQTDSKTGLLNARYFSRRCEEEIQRAQRSGQPLALVMADVDLLRTINNTYGHLAGDAVLAGIAQVIRRSLRSRDLAGRFGGEEFTIVLPETTQVQAKEVIEQIRSTVAASRFTVETHDQPVGATMSFGIACYPQDAATAVDLAHQADIAVYHAKVSGRNKLVSVADLAPEVRAAGIPTREQPTPSAPGPEPASGLQPTSAEAPALAVVPTPEERAAPADDRPKLVTPPVFAKPSPLLWLFVGGVIGLGLALALAPVALGSPLPQLGFVLSMMLLALVAELLQIDLYGSGSVSVSVTMMVAAALIGGIAAVAPLAACIALGAALARRRMQGHWPPLHRIAFNWAVHILSGSLLVLLVGCSRLSLAIDTLPLLLLIVVVASIIYAVIETGLVALAVALSERQRLIALWVMRYRWLLLHYVVLCVMGLFLAVTYTYLGYTGLTVFLLPVVMMRYSQKQYVEHTNRSISERSSLNERLNSANQTIMAANVSMQRLNQDLVSAHASVALLNDELFVTLARIIDARDPAVASHSARVAALALALGRARGLSEERQVQLYRAALLHDIGKIGIAEHILRKPGRLSVDEYAVVKTHALLGATLLESSQHLQPLVPFVRNHHERWDGQGYPDGLAGEAIPLEARILALCDAVEVMTSDRPYRDQMPTSAVLLEVERCAGAHFDPELARCFIGLVERGEIVIEQGQFVDERLA